MAKKAVTVENELVDRPEISETFATEAALIHAEANNVTITFATKRLHQKSQKEPVASVRVVVARVTMPLHAAMQMREALSRALEGYFRAAASTAQPVGSLEQPKTEH